MTIKYGVSLLDNYYLTKLLRFNKEDLNIFNLYKVIYHKAIENDRNKIVNVSTQTKGDLYNTAIITKVNSPSKLTDANTIVSDFKVLKNIENCSEDFTDIAGDNMYVPINFLYNVREPIYEGAVSYTGKKLPENYITQYLPTDFTHAVTFPFYTDFTQVYELFVYDAAGNTLLKGDLVGNKGGGFKVDTTYDVGAKYSVDGTEFDRVLVYVKLNEYTGELNFLQGDYATEDISIEIAYDAINNEYDIQHDYLGTPNVSNISAETDGSLHVLFSIGRDIYINYGTGWVAFNGSNYLAPTMAMMKTNTTSGSAIYYETYCVTPLVLGQTIEETELTSKRFIGELTGGDLLWANKKEGINPYYFVRILATNVPESLLYITYSTSLITSSTKLVSFVPLYYAHDISVVEGSVYTITFPNYFLDTSTVLITSEATKSIELDIDYRGNVYINNPTYYEYNQSKGVPVYYFAEEIYAYYQNFTDKYYEEPFPFRNLRVRRCEIISDNIIKVPRGRIFYRDPFGSLLDWTDSNYDHYSYEVFYLTVNGENLAPTSIQYFDCYNGYVVTDFALSPDDEILISYFSYDDLIQIPNLNLLELVKENSTSALIGLKPSLSLYNVVYPLDPYPNHKLFWTTTELWQNSKGYMAFTNDTEAHWMPDLSQTLLEIELMPSINFLDARIRGGMPVAPEETDPLLIKMWDWGHYDGTKFSAAGTIFIKVTEEDMDSLLENYQTDMSAVLDYLKDYYSTFVPAGSVILFVDNDGETYV